MSDNFPAFGQAVQKQFELMSKGELFVVDIEGDALYAAYQAAFPEGTNPVFRKAREHECSTCRNFIKNIGPVVAIKDGQLMTVWDVATGNRTYDVVAEVMDQLIRSKPIKSIFRAEMPSYGGKPNRDNENAQIVWNHFYGVVDRKHFAKGEAAAKIGEANGAIQVFRRGMTEITKDAINTVYELLNTKDALYRGSEFAFSFGNFVGLRSKYDSLPTPEAKELYLWTEYTQPGARLRNTAFGTLLIDLSEGMDMEAAVKRWETVMAPTNYKRPVALITPRMAEDAMKTINELGIESALQRRFAVLGDVSINDILFVDNEVRNKMKDGGVAGLLMDAAASQRVRAEPASTLDISIDDFMTKVLPNANTMAVLVKNADQNNFVSLTAPVHADAAPLFKWDNGFAWSYNNNVTDSIKERVKAKGGRTDAALRASLAWFNHDDLDLHAIEPSKHEIYFGNRHRKSPNGGQLDVDENAGFGRTREPVENIVWDRLTDGKYQIIVHNYSKRETKDTGYTLQIECNGQLYEYSSKVSPGSGSQHNALIVTIKGGKVESITTAANVSGDAVAQEVWGVHTEQFTKVSTMMLSPNHWGDKAVGNKHFIFILDGCKNPVPTRGIYNEFLKPELDKHRKVFEVLGNKTMCEPTNEQLSGVGFSSTRGDNVIVQVNGGRNYNIKF